MKYFQKYKDLILIISYSLVISFVTLLLTSKCSFFYPFNDWVDANAFFTMGKAMFNGIVPYKDIFEQKGPLLYFIYGIGYLISHKSFIGIFILEIISLTITLYYVSKIVLLYLPKKYSYIIIPLMASFLCTSKAFVSGGSAEELCVPFLVISLYYFLDFFSKNEISSRRLFISGFGAGAIFLIKYTLLGFHFAFMALIFFNLLFQKQYKKAFISCLYFLLGMFLPISIACLYLIFHHALKDFINVYFIVNMTSYSEEVGNIFVRLYKIYKGFISFCFSSGVLEVVLVLLFPIYLFKLNISKNGKISLIILYLFSILGLLWGLKFYKYYILPMLIYMIISLIVIFKLLSKLIKSKGTTSLICISLIISLVLSIFNANYKEARFTSKSNYFQYEFLKYFENYDNPTLVNIGFLDSGLYTTSGIIPSTYFFEKQNINYQKFSNNIDAFAEYIQNKKTDFILYYTKDSLEKIKEKEDVLFKNYELIATKEHLLDGKKFNAFLFLKKN